MFRTLEKGSGMSASAMNEMAERAEEFVDYRMVSKAAVFSLTLGLLSLSAFVGVGMLILPLVGIVCGIVGLHSIAKYPDEFTGKISAWIGIVLSVFFLCAAGSAHAYEYSTEVPDGFQRIPFYSLRSDPDHPEQPIPEDIAKLDGQKVFLKGYVHPSVKEQGAVRQFVLVGDMKECCFGGTPKVTEFVDVSIVSNDQIRYSWRLRKLAGVLRINPEAAKMNGLAGPCYHLEAEYVK